MTVAHLLTALQAAGSPQKNTLATAVPPSAANRNIPRQRHPLTKLARKRAAQMVPGRMKIGKPLGLQQLLTHVRFEICRFARVGGSR